MQNRLINEWGKYFHANNFFRALIIIFEMNLTCANYSLLNIGVDYFKELQQSQKPSNSSVCTRAAGFN